MSAGAGAGRPAVEAFLAEFHDRSPGMTPPAFARTPVADEHGAHFASSYHALAARLAGHASTLPAGPVLDLACGDGHLLDLLRATPGLGSRGWIGADLSAGELAAARARLGLDVPLAQARAQALPFGARSVAAIVCHMALMLMSPPEAVLDELARVLAPGGRLLAIVPRAGPAGGSLEPVIEALRDAFAPEPADPRWQDVRFEGRRWREPDALRELLAARFGSATLVALDGQQALEVDAAWDWFAGMYDLALRSHDAAERVRSRFIAATRPRARPDGRITLSHRYLLIDAVVAR